MDMLLTRTAPVETETKDDKPNGENAEGDDDDDDEEEDGSNATEATGMSLECQTIGIQFCSPIVHSILNSLVFLHISFSCQEEEEEKVEQEEEQSNPNGTPNNSCLQDLCQQDLS